MRQLAALADFLLAAVLLAACSKPPEPPQVVAGAVPTVDYLRGADWPSYNRDLAGTRFSPLRQVSSTNVDELRQAWSYPLGSASAGVGGSELTPLVVDGVLYATAADRVVALRADTGAEIWRFALAQGVPSQRGLAYWALLGPEVEQRSTEYDMDAAIALMQATDDHVGSIGTIFGERLSEDELRTLCDFLERLHPQAAD